MQPGRRPPQTSGGRTVGPGGAAGGGAGKSPVPSGIGWTTDGKIAGLYDLEETIGKGHYAVVKLARHVFTGERVAVKVIDKTKLDEVSRAHLFQEVRCMKLVQHPNVVRLYEVIDTQTRLYLILEWGDGGDMYDHIMKHERGLSEDVAREYFKQIVHAINYCHQLHVVHRDLKPENVVFFEQAGICKLTDFGFSNKFVPGRKLDTSCGSLAYSAPEILLGDSYDAPAVDIWSLGVILYMLVCGEAPFREANDSETLTMIMDCRYTLPSHISLACHDVIKHMIVREPSERSSLAEIIRHPWMCAGDHNERGAPQYPLTTHTPLAVSESLSAEDHGHIIQRMVDGNIAPKEDIVQYLKDKAYNHITATYYLLAERLLRKRREAMAVSSLSLSSSSSSSMTTSGVASEMKPALSPLSPSPRINVPDGDPRANNQWSTYNSLVSPPGLHSSPHGLSTTDVIANSPPILNLSNTVKLGGTSPLKQSLSAPLSDTSPSSPPILTPHWSPSLTPPSLAGTSPSKGAGMTRVKSDKSLASLRCPLIHEDSAENRQDDEEDEDGHCAITNIRQSLSACGLSVSVASATMQAPCFAVNRRPTAIGMQQLQPATGMTPFALLMSPDRHSVDDSELQIKSQSSSPSSSWAVPSTKVSSLNNPPPVSGGSGTPGTGGRQQFQSSTRPLYTVSSSPQLLNEIYEEGESAAEEDNDEFIVSASSPMVVAKSRHLRAHCITAATRPMTSPDVMRKYERLHRSAGGGGNKKRGSGGGVGGRTTSCSSSDTSDTDDVDGSRKQKVKTKAGLAPGADKFNLARRDSSEHSSDTDGPTGPGGDSSVGGRGTGAGSTHRRCHSGGDNRRDGGERGRDTNKSRDQHTSKKTSHSAKENGIACYHSDSGSRHSSLEIVVTSSGAVESCKCDSSSHLPDNKYVQICNSASENRITDEQNRALDTMHNQRNKKSNEILKEAMLNNQNSSITRSLSNQFDHVTSRTVSEPLSTPGHQDETTTEVCPRVIHFRSRNFGDLIEKFNTTSMTTAKETKLSDKHSSSNTLPRSAKTNKSNMTAGTNKII